MYVVVSHPSGYTSPLPLKQDLPVLIIDDQGPILEALTVLFEFHDIPCVTAASPDAGLELVRTQLIGAVVQDMNFREDKTSGEEGIALFRAIKELDPELPIVLMTAWTHLETAVELVREGAGDYVEKPWDDDKLVRTVDNLRRMRKLQLDNDELRMRGVEARVRLARDHDLCGLVYQSDAMHEVVSLAINVARSDASILVTGPNGSGKEKIAEIIQRNSRRSDKPFVKVNAGGLPDELLEAELFGAEAGAYTGATKRRVGRFEAADHGTLFLDEIGNMSTSGQMKLLRVLQTGEFERLGSSQTRRVDTRIVSATNADLAGAIARGEFREDLFYRLAVIEVRIPGLADRVDDILPLAQWFLSQQEGGPWRLSQGAIDALTSHAWPGNVRELENRLQRACLVAGDDTISSKHLGLDSGSLRATQPPAAPIAAGAPAETKPAASDPERADIEAALIEADGIVSKAASALGLSRQALYRRMDRLGIVLERRPR